MASVHHMSLRLARRLGEQEGEVEEDERNMIVGQVVVYCTSGRPSVRTLLS